MGHSDGCSEEQSDDSNMDEEDGPHDGCRWKLGKMLTGQEAPHPRPETLWEGEFTG